MKAAAALRGIISTYDVAIALTIFTFIALFYLSALSHVAMQANNIESVAERVAANLFESYGIPPDWHVSFLSNQNFNEVLSVGLAKDFGEIDWKKVEALYNMSANDYDKTRLKLGIGRYNFYLEIGDLVIGKAPTNAKNVIVITRKVLAGGDAKDAKLCIWQ